MKHVFGVLSLLVALAIVALIVKQQMHSISGSTPMAASSPDGKPANVADQSRQMQEQVRNDVQKALDAGMQRDRDADRKAEGDQ